MAGVAAFGASLALVAVLAAAPAATTGCAGQQGPSPPAAVEETSVPPPLPWPAEPVGGAQLGACGNVGPTAPPTVTVASYVLADLDSGAVLAARAPHERQRPASTLKVLTSLVVLARLDPDTVVDGTADDLRVDGSKVGIGPGGRYTVRQLLQGLLLNSGNDAAEALARALGGDAATVAAMAETARGLGALDTRPATPSGLDGPGMATSAYDLALLFRVAMRDPLFSATTATRTVPFPGYGDHPGFVLSNSDQFLPRYPGAIAGKSGFTDAARHTLIAAAQRGGHRLVAVLVRGEQRPVPMWQQAAALLDLGFATPAGAAPIGTLVDAPPPALPPVVETTPTPAAPEVAPTSDWSVLAVVGAAVAIGAGGITLLAVRRRRGRERGHPER